MNRAIIWHEQQARTRRGVVVVTGASAGIGRAIVRAFAADGWDVALLARESPRLREAADEVRGRGRHALALAVDIADAEAVESAADTIEATLGPIDVWVNDAMATVFSPALALSSADVRRATEVTYLGAVWGTLAALRRMVRRDRGTIIQIGSALAYRSIPLQAPYCGAKAALRGFTDSIRCELIHERSRVRITMLQLSAFNTPQFEWGRAALDRRPRPMGRIFQPEIAARAALRAARRPRRETWVGWPAVQTLLGQRLLPGTMDRILGRSGYEGQLSAEPMPERRPDNLYHAVHSPRGAHGRFDAQARGFSAQAWMNEHRVATAIATGALAWGAARWLKSARSRRGSATGGASRERSLPYD